MRAFAVTVRFFYRIFVFAIRNIPLLRESAGESEYDLELDRPSSLRTSSAPCHTPRFPLPADFFSLPLPPLFPPLLRPLGVGGAGWDEDEVGAGTARNDGPTVAR